MVQWQEPAVEARLGLITMNMIYLLLGLYGWEYFQSLDVEYAVIRGRLSFRWPLIPYLLGRMFLFIFLLLLVIRTNPPSTSFICLPGAMATAISGDIGLASSSANLMIRTWVIWKDSTVVHTLLLVCTVGHWIVLAFDVANIRSTDLNGGCFVYVSNERVNGAVLLYSLGYDCLVLVLSIVGLSRQSSKSPLTKRLRAQGVVYFVVAVVTYIPPTVFAILRVNIMVALTGLPAITASTIASCRAVRSLLGPRTPNSSQMTEESLENEVALTTQIPVQTITTAAAW